MLEAGLGTGGGEVEGRVDPHRPVGRTRGSHERRCKTRAGLGGGDLAYGAITNRPAS